MIFVTFGILRNCKLKGTFHQIYKKSSIDVTRAQVDAEKLSGEGGYVEVLSSWPAEEEPGLRAEVVRRMRVLPAFLSQEEEAAMLSEVEPHLQRMRYEYDHWDNAIEGYRETERDSWGAAGAAVLQRVRRAAFPAGAALLPRAHVLDLAAAGHIKPHVDAVRFCGDTIAGLCLASSAVMRLTHALRPHLALDALLERRCLYIMSGVARYEFAHAVLGDALSTWRGQRVARRRRVAVICREQPRPERSS